MFTIIYIPIATFAFSIMAWDNGVIDTIKSDWPVFIGTWLWAISMDCICFFVLKVQ